ncbi:hypothetical protein [Paraburkholderia terrae]|uniref:hypothetical protein n=1 Tax=Paraburkholderia terrae TaxID=311230 RepID=UPI00336542A0
METGNVVPERKDECPKRACRVTDGSYGIPGKAGCSPKSWLACHEEKMTVAGDALQMRITIITQNVISFNPEGLSQLPENVAVVCGLPA